MTRGSKTSDEDKRRIVAAVEKDKLTYGIMAAARNNGVSDKTYYNWKYSLRKQDAPAKKTILRKVKQPSVQEIVITPQPPTSGRLMCLVGSPDEIAAFAKQYGSI